MLYERVPTVAEYHFMYLGMVQGCRRPEHRVICRPRQPYWKDIRYDQRDIKMYLKIKKTSISLGCESASVCPIYILDQLWILVCRMSGKATFRVQSVYCLNSSKSTLSKTLSNFTTCYIHVYHVYYHTTYSYHCYLRDIGSDLPRQDFETLGQKGAIRGWKGPFPIGP